MARSGGNAVESSRNWQAVSTKELHHFTLPPAVKEGSVFSTSSPALALTSLLIRAITLRVKWVLTCEVGFRFF